MSRAPDETLHFESCRPLEWPGPEAVDEKYVRNVLSRMRAAAHADYSLLSIFGMTKASLSRLLADARTVFSKEDNVLHVDVPPHGHLHVYGDIHGCLFSLFAALDISGLPGENNPLVIAGDMVDRGVWSVEVIICVFVLKLWRPRCVLVLRGNHETSFCAQVYVTAIRVVSFAEYLWTSMC
jgi:Calcineurin-like phosphoesterase